ncbi:hypothetical protein [Bacillus altitudinis]|uniref:hypothetical protein n=1 Tax=Bacillus altitudinis TaxID=293387 RepID=UPI002942610A|nr:hypothetical protein [Bacillus altitudinis]WOI43357.1 hypothetical protein RZ534_19875 [Bacillus altitudinis]
MSFKRALLKATYDFAKAFGKLCLWLLGISLILTVFVLIAAFIFEISVWFGILYYLILAIFVYAGLLYAASKEEEKAKEKDGMA